MATVLNVAKYILKKLGGMTPMKLQKLCYYCQAWALAWDGKPLFDEDFEAWVHGPVCPVLFDSYGDKLWIETDFFDKLPNYSFTPSEVETMDIVLNDYGDKEEWWLSSNTHEEAPWQMARDKVPSYENSHNIISKASMKDYYSESIK